MSSSNPVEFRYVFINCTILYMFDNPQIRSFARVDLQYQSQEDFRLERAILRCSPEFHTRKRYDGVLLRTTTARFGRIEGLFRCKLANGECRDVALVQAFKEVGWRPSTSWSGCRVVEESESMFVTPDYLIRGVLLVDTDLEGLTANRFFVDDTVDPDIFLRMGN
jgi:hypothetical protein